MNSIKKSVSAIPSLCLLMIFAASVPVMAEPPSIVAKVGTIAIDAQEVQREVQKKIPMQVSFHGGLKPEKLEKIRSEAKETLITRAYKVQYAMDNGIAVDAKVVDAEWAAALAKNPALAQASADQLAVWKKDVSFELLAKQSEDLVVNSRVSITEEEIRQYYEANAAQFFQAKLFKASHVFVKVNPAETPEEKDAKRQRAEKLMERAKTGEDFYNLAYYESDDRTRYVGGSLGSFHAGQAAQELDAALQEMKPGEIRGPIHTLYGYHILKLDDVHEGRQLTLEQVSDKIRSRLAEEKRKKLYDDWMSGLKQKYPMQTSAN